VLSAGIRLRSKLNKPIIADHYGATQALRDAFRLRLAAERRDGEVFDFGHRRRVHLQMIRAAYTSRGQTWWVSLQLSQGRRPA